MTKLNKLSTETIRDFEEVEIAEKDDSNLIYIKEPNSFSTHKPVDYITESDLQQLRDWKNKVIEIRDSKKGSELYVKWDLEAKRIVEFLSSFNE